MELSHSHKFIFIHVYRCGGQSVSAALQPYVYNPGPRLGRVRVLGRLGDHRFRALRGQRWGHIKAKELRAGLGAEVFDQFFKFAFVRNPWDWQVSNWHYVRQREDHPEHDFYMTFGGFEDYLDWRINDIGPEQQSEFILSDAGELLIDYVGRFETIGDHFATIARLVGIDAPLPHRNASQHGDFRDYYTPETRALVQDAYKEDIELFGYEFDSREPLPPLVTARTAALIERGARQTA